MYNKELFDLSVQANTLTNFSKTQTDSEIIKQQNELLKILFEKFKEEIVSQGKLEDGVIRIRFKREFFQDAEPGYWQIDRLVNSNNFNSFASKYCMYLGDYDGRCNEWNTSYYELIWDYYAYCETHKEENMMRRKSDFHKESNNCDTYDKKMPVFDYHDFSHWMKR